MNYVELQEEIKKRGLNISVITLRRYVKAGLIPEPKRKHFGRGKGEQVDFPIEAIAEAIAAKQVFLEERFPAVELVKKARDLALEALKEKDALAAILADNRNILPEDYKTKSLAAEWLKFYILIRDGHSLNTPGYWNYVDNEFKFIADGGKMRETIENGFDILIKTVENLTEEQRKRLNEEANKQIKALIKTYESKQ